MYQTLHFIEHEPIDNDTIHLWVIPLNDTSRNLDDYRTILSISEREQGDRFRFPELKRRYLVAHARMREILAGYINHEPGDITFTLNQFNKPSLAGVPDQERIDFNLSHSYDLAVLGIARNRLIGVDVEWEKPMVDHLKIARKYFSPMEYSAIMELRSDRSLQAFFQLWTGKEALIKARGAGLSLPLNEFNLDGLIKPAGKANHSVNLQVDGDSWSIYPIKVRPGYLGAVAVEGQILAIQVYNG